MERLYALIIDDDPAFRMLLGSLLSRYRIDAARFDDPEAAIRCACKRHPDIVFVDLVRRHGRGADLVKRFVRIPSLIDIPVVVTSACDSREAIVEAIQSGAVEYLLKPIDEERLLLKLAQTLIVDIEALRARSSHDIADRSTDRSDIDDSENAAPTPASPEVYAGEVSVSELLGHTEEGEEDDEPAETPPPSRPALNEMFGMFDGKSDVA